MPTSPDKRYESLAQQALEEGTHYLNSIAAMTDRGEVTAGDDIYASNGMKLAAKGALVDEQTRQKLLQHKLLQPAGLDLRTTLGLTAASLAQHMAQLIDGDASLRQLAERSGDPLALRHGLARLPLPPQLAFMLTVAQEQRPELFRHLLTVTLIAHYLALGKRLPERETVRLLLAALCHDIGELHTDPALLNPQHRIGDEERRYIYVHPITGYLIVRAIMGDDAVAAAVLQHQERLDGSGYPYGLRADAVGMAARIVGVADVCASILARFGSNERLSALMRLNRQKFDTSLLALLQEGFRHPADAPDGSAASPVRRLLAAARVLERWGTLRSGLAAATDGSAPPELDFLFERMANLRYMLVQFGFDPDSQQYLIALVAEDPQVAAELGAALDEVHWHFSDLEREIARNGETIAAALDPAASESLHAWIADLRDYIAAG